MESLKVGDAVLVPYYDHAYRVAKVTRGLAVFNKVTYSWSEFQGEEHLTSDDVVCKIWIVV